MNKLLTILLVALLAISVSAFRTRVDLGQSPDTNTTATDTATTTGKIFS